LRNKSIKDKLRKWGNNNGKSLQDVFNIFLQKDKNGNYIPKLHIKIDYHRLIENWEKVKNKKAEAAEFLETNYDIDAYRKEAWAYIQEEYAIIDGSTLDQSPEKNNLLKNIKKNKLLKKFLPQHISYLDPKNNFILRKHLRESLWESDFYKEITKSGNEALLEFYEYMQEIITRINSSNAETEVLKTFVPQAPKGWVEGGRKEFFKNILRGVQINPKDYEFGYINPITQQVEQKLYIPLTKDLAEEKDGEKDYSSVSKDLLSLFLSVEFQLINVENIQSLEAFSNLLGDFEAAQEVIPLNRFGKILKNRLNKGNITPVLEGKAGSNYKYYDKFKRYYIYNQSIQDLTEDSAFTIPFTDITISGAKLIQNIMTVARGATFGLNIAAPLRNFVMGRISTLVHGNHHFASKISLQNSIDFIENLNFLPSSERHRKIAGMLDFVLPMLSMEEGRKKDKVSVTSGFQILTNENLHHLMKKSSDYVQIPIFIALLENSTVREGKIVNINELVEQEMKDKYNYTSLYSLPDSKIKEITKEMNERKEELHRKDNLFNYMEIEGDKFNLKGVEREDESVNRLRSLSQAYAMRMTGESTSQDINLMTASVLARMLLMYRSWIPKTVQVRFGELSKDEILGWTEGRLRSFYKTVFMEENGNLLKKLGIFVSGVAGFSKKDAFREIIKKRWLKEKQLLIDSNSLDNLNDFLLDEFIKLQETNIQSAFKDVRTTFLLFLLGSLIVFAGGGEGADDEEKQLRNLIQLEITKYYQEFSFYYNPFEALSIFKSPFPIASYLSNWADFFKQVVAEPFYPDENKPMKYFFRGVPITKQIINYSPLFDAELAKKMGVDINPNPLFMR